MLTYSDYGTIKRYRRSIQVAEDVLADDERRMDLGFSREYLEAYRTERFCALINYQVRTFDRS